MSPVYVEALHSSHALQLSKALQRHLKKHVQQHKRTYKSMSAACEHIRTMHVRICLRSG